MNAFVTRVKRFLSRDDGPTTVEYAVMLAFIVTACVGIVGALGQTLSSTFVDVNNSLASG